MNFEGKDIRMLGFMGFTFCIMIAFFAFGVFVDHMIIFNLMFGMYVLGLLTSVFIDFIGYKNKKKYKKAKKNEGKR